MIPYADKQSGMAQEHYFWIHWLSFFYILVFGVRNGQTILEELGMIDSL